MTISTYNPDKGYELMANIVNSEMGPYDETAREDMVHILRLCYIYSADEGKPNEMSAGDLGQAIVAYLSGGWGIPDFENDAKEYWNPPKQNTTDGEPKTDERATGDLPKP